MRNAARIQESDALLACAHSSWRSTRDSKKVSSTMLTAILTAMSTYRRPEGRSDALDTDGHERESVYYLFVEKAGDGLRILMIAPEPFFQPRGTPFSEFHRIRALTDLGHEID